MVMGKISMLVLGAWLPVHKARRCRKLPGAEDIKLQFETADKHRIGDLFRSIVN